MGTEKASLSTRAESTLFLAKIRGFSPREHVIMKTRVKPTDKRPTKKRSGHIDELERELNRALEESISNLSARYDAILQQYKDKDELKLSA